MKISTLDLAISANKAMDELNVIDKSVREEMMPEIIRKIKADIASKRADEKAKYFNEKEKRRKATDLAEYEKSKLESAWQLIADQNLIAADIAENQAENSPVAATQDKSLNVWVSNRLNSAAHSLSINEKRIMMLAATTINPKDIRADYSPVASIHSNDMIDMFGLTGAAARSALRDAAGVSGSKADQNKLEVYGLSTKYIQWVSVDAKGNNQYTTMPWVHKVAYHEGTGVLELHIWHEVVPFLTTKMGAFTKYELSDLKAVTSKHSFRIYEILSQYKRIRNKTITLGVDEINFMLELGMSYQNNFGLTKKIFNEAIAELAGVLPFTYEPIMTGRKTTAVTFRIGNRATKAIS